MDIFIVADNSHICYFPWCPKLMFIFDHLAVKIAAKNNNKHTLLLCFLTLMKS